MADESLTEAEIAVLLGDRAKVSVCDSIAPEQLLALVTRILDAAARHFGAELSGMLRRTARVRLARVHSCSETDFCARAELPSYMRSFHCAPFARPWIVEIRPGALFPIIDCLLGGGREKTPIARRPLTEIESRLAARIVRQWLASLQHAWQATIPLAIAAELEPVKVSRAADVEMLSIAFDLELAGSQGSMHLAVPLVELGEICGAAAPQADCSEAASGTKVVAQLRDIAIEPGELDSLAIGDVITTDHPAGSPVIITQDGVPRFEAKLGAWQGQKAIEIERELEPPEPPAESD